MCVQTESVFSRRLRSSRSLYELHKKVPYKPDHIESRISMRKSSLNSNRVGDWMEICQTHSINWRNTGENSLSRSPLEYNPPRSANLCEKEHHSFSMRMMNPSIVR